MGKLIIGLIGIGTVLAAIGIANGNSTLTIVGIVFLGVGILLTRVTGQG